MNYRLIVKYRATQDLRNLANYILVNGNTDTAVKFLSAIDLCSVAKDSWNGKGNAVSSIEIG
ncbi:hypothetical protein A6770_40345 [Nostoc minutum NIES-26]|uniref:Uncharacterized protein n=1 Tax=Nostoc minutum NIES-26 TaxID=1844469 RepID=A0A367RNN9_9NOSO|nr:hypothetical protein A6770_40345 [Nostoc minutum NIES-26]